LIEHTQNTNLSFSHEILDINAGYRQLWNGLTQNVFFLDRRKEVNPDIVASNEYLPFMDKSFKKVMYDPPHLIRNSPLTETCMMKQYERKFTLWKTKSAFLRNMVLVNKEAYRVLTDDGELIIKHTDSPDNSVTQQTVSNCFDLFKINRIRQQETKGWGKSKVYFLTCIKKEDSQEA
jgi:hypothetical protein